MKKNFCFAPILVACLGAWIISTAAAADVEMYGIIDTGLHYQHIDPDDGSRSSNTFSLDSGISTGSRFGLRGSESLGEKLTAGFVLENGFANDTGTMQQGSRLFGREAQVYLDGRFGRVAFGRFGSLTSGSGSYAIAGKLSPFGTTWGDYAANAPNVMSGFDRYDNMISYRSPEWSGVRLHAQYSFGTDSKNYLDGAAEGKSSVDRYYAIGVTYGNGPLNLVLIADSTNFSNIKWSDATTGEGSWGEKADDAITATAGGSYDFGSFKLYAGAQYFDNADVSSLDGLDLAGRPGVGSQDLHQMSGFGMTAGIDTTLWGTKWMVAVGYADAKIDTRNGSDLSDSLGDIDFRRWVASLGFSHNLSKRTSVYGVVSYLENRYDENNNPGFDEVKPSAVEAALGLVHKF